MIHQHIVYSEMSKDQWNFSLT